MGCRCTVCHERRRYKPRKALIPCDACNGYGRRRERFPVTHALQGKKDSMKKLLDETVGEAYGLVMPAPMLEMICEFTEEPICATCNGHDVVYTHDGKRKRIYHVVKSEEGKYSLVDPKAKRS